MQMMNLSPLIGPSALFLVVRRESPSSQFRCLLLPQLLGRLETYHTRRPAPCLPLPLVPPRQRRPLRLLQLLSHDCSPVSPDLPPSPLSAPSEPPLSKVRKKLPHPPVPQPHHPLVRYSGDRLSRIPLYPATAKGSYPLPLHFSFQRRVVAPYCRHRSVHFWMG